ncbi:hypothetical protein [Trinickia sp.]|uniref:hypothetical protein n=1 Tax=Trinickia sp. TaxID=2571163 RepID=UPI003F816756
MLETSQVLTHTPVDAGPLVQAFLTGAQMGLSAPGTSPLILAGGYPKIAIGAQSSATGSITVQRYLDQGGAIPQGAALTQALTAATPGVLNITDGLPFQSFTVAIAGGTLSNVGALFSSR